MTGRRRFSPVLLHLLLLAGLFTLSGCANYRLGTEGKLAFQTLYLAPIENEAGLPQAVAEVSSLLRERFMRDPRVTLVADETAADVSLAVNLTGYRREVATVRPGDTGLARKYNLVLDATATLTDNRTSTALFTDRPVQAKRQSFTDDGQLQAEYQALPLLAMQLADRAAHAVLDVW